MFYSLLGLQDLSDSLRFQGKPDEAYEVAHELVRSARAAGIIGSTESNVDSPWFLLTVAHCCVRLRKYAEGESVTREAIHECGEYRSGRLFCLPLLGFCLEKQGKFLEADECRREAFDICENRGHVFYPFPEMVDQLIDLRLQVRHYAAAESWIRKCMDVTRGKPNYGEQRRLVHQYQLCHVLMDQGKTEEANVYQRIVVMELERALEKGPAIWSAQRDRWRLAELLGSLHADEPALLRALTLVDEGRALAADADEDTDTLCDAIRGPILFKLGRTDEAIAVQQRSLNSRTAKDVKEYRQREASLLSMLRSNDDLQGIENVLRQGLQQRLDVLVLNHPEIDFCRVDLAAVLIEQDKFSEAEKLLEAAAQRLRDQDMCPRREMLRICELLNELYEHMGDKEKAALWKSQLEDISASPEREHSGS